MTSVVSVRIFRLPDGDWSFSPRDKHGQVVPQTELPTVHPSKQFVMAKASDAYPNAEMVEYDE